MPPVKLTFFCELEGEELETLFADPSVIAHLRELRARLALGILDFSIQRSEVVRRLNESGIPVIAWQLLPKDQGYWYNMCNAPLAVNRYGAFCAWTAEQGLQWAAIGVDIEPDIAEIHQLLTHKLRLVRTLMQRGCSRSRLYDARTAYYALVARMQSDGYAVESYEFPFIVDELKAGSTLLRRILGVTDVPANLSVLMLYTSFFRPYGAAVLESYARDADAVGIGLTGGGVDLGDFSQQAALSWDEFSRDLCLARQWTRNIHIFSLEGCVRRGFLEKLERFDWEQPAPPPQPWRRLVELGRRALQAGLWVTAHPFVSFAILVGMICLVTL